MQLAHYGPFSPVLVNDQRDQIFLSIYALGTAPDTPVQYTRDMTLLYIALLLGAGVLGIIIAATRRHSGGSVELGTMSNAWVAEQRAGEQSYYER